MANPHALTEAVLGVAKIYRLTPDEGTVGRVASMTMNFILKSLVNIEADNTPQKSGEVGLTEPPYRIGKMSKINSRIRPTFVRGRVNCMAPHIPIGAENFNVIDGWFTRGFEAYSNHKSYCGARASICSHKIDVASAEAAFEPKYRKLMQRIIDTLPGPGRRDDAPISLGTSVSKLDPLVRKDLKDQVRCATYFRSLRKAPGARGIGEPEEVGFTYCAVQRVSVPNWIRMDEFNTILMLFSQGPMTVSVYPKLWLFSNTFFFWAVDFSSR